MSTLITHHPIAPSPDDDPTGVRALLSALPEPDPMPDYLVGRINASLAAEQTQRAASSSGPSVTPLLATKGPRHGRLLFAIAGAAAAVALVGVVSSNLLKAVQPAGTSSSAAAAITPGTQEASSGAPLSADDKAAALSGGASTPPLIQIRLSGTRYTQADFVTQARTLLALAPTQPMAVESPGVGPVGTTVGLTDCLSAIGAGGAQVVRADLAFYEGAPAVIIVATTDGIRMAYAVGRSCTRADAAVMRPATPLP